MTLVVTEVSEQYGCVVVGDSAVTVGGDVIFGAEKVHFAAAPNIGFAVWGNACLAGRRIDALISSFASALGGNATPRSAGRELASLLSAEASKDGRSWDALRGGIHICGYEKSIPVLFHVHTGQEPPATQSPYQLFEDFPDARTQCHLRNGYYRTFSVLFEGMQQYVDGLSQLGHKWPHASVEDRVSYYSIMVDTVAKTLEAAGRAPAVGGKVSAFAFNRSGIQVDKRVPRGTADICRSKATMAYFGKPPSNHPVKWTRQEQRTTYRGR